MLRLINYKKISWSAHIKVIFYNLQRETLFKKLTLRVCLDRTYFAETENLLLKSL